MDKMDFSYLAQRRLIGILGILLSFLLVIGAGLQRTISQYYFTNMRDILTAVLVITGVFLLTYKGYSRLDNIVSAVAGASMILTGLFPTSQDGVIFYSFLNISARATFLIHTIFSALLFISLSFMSCFLFTKSDATPIGKKKTRNIIYICSGSIMFLFLIVLAFVNGLKLNWDPFVFFAEAIMLICFGVSWLIKGRTILKG